MVIKKKRQISADFYKRTTLYGNTFYKKDKSRPCSFAQVSVQQIREMDIIGVDLQKFSVSTLNPPVFMNTVRLKPHYFVLKTGSGPGTKSEKEANDM